MGKSPLLRLGFYIWAIGCFPVLFSRTIKIRLQILLRKIKRLTIANRTNLLKEVVFTVLL